MDDLRNNENRARFKNDSVNRMTPANEYAGCAPPRSFNDLPPPIRGDAPMMLDPHAGGRHGFDNMVNKPGEKSRAAESAETRRRLRPGSGDVYK
jgi:hypothetical protein